MKITETVEYMSQMYLGKVVKGIALDYPKKSEEGYRNAIRDNQEILADPEEIKENIQNKNFSYSDKILVKFVFTTLLSLPRWLGTQDTIIQKVQEREKELIKRSNDENALKHFSERDKEIFSEVLEVAFHDEEISEDEAALINRLRKKLGFSEKEQFLLQARLDYFPTAGGDVHQNNDIERILKELQECGVIFHCNRAENDFPNYFYVIPEEIGQALKQAYGLELVEKNMTKLYKRFTKAQLKEVLEFKNLHRYGSKDELIQRIITSGIRPSEALEQVKSSDLSEICRDLPGVKVSGAKEEKINRIIQYFSNLIRKEVRDQASEGEKYYEYLEQLAERDIQNLVGNEILNKASEVENAFEEGTRYLFKNKFNLELLEHEGSEHPDGCIEFTRNNDLFMWDNKSKETEYTFPNKHRNQFKRYIRDAEQRVTAFLIIVPEVEDSAERNIFKLKAESQTDTDVAIINTEDLKWTAENWEKRGNSNEFDLEVLNYTGILDRNTLKRRMDSLL